MTLSAPAERRYLSQYSTDVLGLAVHVEGELADPDAQQVQIRLADESTQAVVADRAATRVDVGLYEIQLTQAETSRPGYYVLTWRYAVGGIAEDYDTYLTIGQASPDYDLLPEELKEIVESVWMRFADGFDSAAGGPNLQSYFQSYFGRGRLAQLLRVGVGRLNTMAQPFQTYTVDQFPVAQWGALLEQSLYVEVIKHLRRSYVEQPMFQGSSVSRVDRRDYLERWGEILREEEDDFKRRLDVFKIANMNLGRPSVLVGGGVYGRYAPTRYAGSAAARGKFWARFW